MLEPNKGAGKKEEEAVGRKPEKLDLVSALIKKLWPRCCFMVAIWNPSRRQKNGSFVEFITNCQMEEAAGLLRDTADHVDKTSALDSNPCTRGNA